jgi:hypothetical protein
MKVYLLAVVGLLIAGSLAWAEEDLMDLPEREPNAVNVVAPSAKRTYPGGADEEDLQVQAHLPEAEMKENAHAVQREVFKELYNQEMKEERNDTVEE